MNVSTIGIPFSFSGSEKPTSLFVRGSWQIFPIIRVPSSPMQTINGNPFLFKYSNSSSVLSTPSVNLGPLSAMYWFTRESDGIHLERFAWSVSYIKRPPNILMYDMNIFTVSSCLYDVFTLSAFFSADFISSDSNPLPSSDDCDDCRDKLELCKLA